MFTGGQIPNIPFGFYDLQWVDWWLVLLGMTFVMTTLYTPDGLGGLFDLHRKSKEPSDG